MLRLNRRHVYRDNVAPSSGMKARAHIHVLEGATPYQCEENGAYMCILETSSILQHENFAAIIIGTVVNI